MKSTTKEAFQHPLFTDLFFSPWHQAIAIHAKYHFVCQTSEVIFLWCLVLQTGAPSWGTAIHGFWSTDSKLIETARMFRGLEKTAEKG